MASMVSKQRLAFLDGLRGLAVLLMMEQNIGIWLWQSDGPMRFWRHPVLFSLNGIGGLAGPLFITMAGISSALFITRHGSVDRSAFTGHHICGVAGHLKYTSTSACPAPCICGPLQTHTIRRVAAIGNFNPVNGYVDRTLALRGLVIMAFGYVMNAITPGLFSMGSWFTLHMIGFAILITPVFRRLSPSHIVLLAAGILIGTGWLHHLLQTPLKLSLYQMRTGAPVRVMLAEGYYTVFPWLAFYLAGFATGRCYLQRQTGAIVKWSFASFLISILFCACRMFQLDFAVKGPAAPFFRLNLGFFPTPPLFVMLFFPLVALLFIFFDRLGQKLQMGEGHFLVSLGRISMTLQIAHVFLFYEVSQRTGLFRSFSTLETLSLLIGVLGVTALAAALWRQANYKFSSEWALRRIVG